MPKRSKQGEIRGDDAMLAILKGCTSFAEWRDRGLGEGQEPCAKRAGVTVQAWSYMERNGLPKRWRERRKYIEAMRLDARNTRVLKEISRINELSGKAVSA